MLLNFVDLSTIYCPRLHFSHQKYIFSTSHQNLAKLDMKKLWSCPIFLDFFTFAKYCFCNFRSSTWTYNQVPGLTLETMDKEYNIRLSQVKGD